MGGSSEIEKWLGLGGRGKKKTLKKRDAVDKLSTKTQTGSRKRARVDR